MTMKPDADIEPLNALLTAEYNAITAYSAGAMLIANAPSSDPLYDLRSVIVDIAVDFQAQHKLHAEALVAAIEDLDGAPVDEEDVAKVFAPPPALVANPSISNVLKFAAGAERGAAVAYNQVLAGLEAAQLRFLASAIEGDESQHFIVLAALVLGLAAPGPNLSSQRAGDVVPEAFVSSVGTWQGLDKAPPDYFA
jgi:ferritin-like protein